MEFVILNIKYQGRATQIRPGPKDQVFQGKINHTLAVGYIRLILLKEDMSNENKMACSGFQNTEKKEPDMERCSNCRKILFRKRNGSLVCPNECGQNTQRRAFNTVIEHMKDRRVKWAFDPWSLVKY